MTTKFTGVVGGINSIAGQLALGYDAGDEIVVIWIRMYDSSIDVDEVDFGPDDSGRHIHLVKNKPTVLTRAQAALVKKEGGILLTSETV